MENKLQRMLNWFAALSVREKMLIAIAGALASAVLAIYAVLFPLLGAIEAKRDQYAIALERRGAIQAQVQDAVGANPKVMAVPAGSVEQVVSQSAAEAGFVLDRADAISADKVDIVMSKAKPIAFMTWLSEWGQRGILAERLTIKADADGTIAVTASLTRQKR